MEVGDRVKVIEPKNSGQLGKEGDVMDVGELVVVKLDGEQRNRNFQPTHLEVIKDGE